MFCVVYEFDVIPEQEDEFKRLWHEITLEVKAHDGGLGSRLHKMIGKKIHGLPMRNGPLEKIGCSVHH